MNDPGGTCLRCSTINANGITALLLCAIWQKSVIMTDIKIWTQLFNKFFISNAYTTEFDSFHSCNFVNTMPNVRNNWRKFNLLNTQILHFDSANVFDSISHFNLFRLNLLLATIASLHVLWGLKLDFSSKSHSLTRCFYAAENNLISKHYSASSIFSFSCWSERVSYAYKSPEVAAFESLEREHKKLECSIYCKF
jgi:hypothetical protein